MSSIIPGVVSSNRQPVTINYLVDTNWESSAYSISLAHKIASNGVNYVVVGQAGNGIISYGDRNSWLTANTAVGLYMRGVAASGARYCTIAVDHSGFGVYSYDSIDNGDTWLTSPSALPSSQFWIDLGASPTSFIAIVGLSPNGIVARRTTTGTWSQSNPLTSANWQRVNWGNNTYLIVASNGRIAVSTDDGVSWTDAVETGGSVPLSDACWNGSYWCAVATNGAIYRSATGLTGSWSLVRSASGQTTYCIAQLDGVFYAPVYNSATCIYSDDDGATWSSFSLSESSTWYDIASNSMSAIVMSATTGNRAAIHPPAEDPVFVRTDKEVVTETVPEFIPNPTPVPDIAGVGGKMLTIIGNDAYCVKSSSGNFDYLIRFNKNTLEFIEQLDSFGDCIPIYWESGVLRGCSNTDNRIHAMCTDGTYLYVSSYGRITKYDTDLNVVATNQLVNISIVSSTVQFSKLHCFGTFLVGTYGPTIYYLNKTTLQINSNATPYNELISTTDGNDLYIVSSVPNETNVYQLAKISGVGLVMTILYTGSLRRTPFAFGDYVYYGNLKIDKNTGSSTSLTFDIDGVSGYQDYASYQSRSANLFAILTPNVMSYNVMVVDTTDDSVKYIRNFQETGICGGVTVYVPTQGIGLLSDTKLITSNRMFTCGSYDLSGDYGGYSVYELQ